MHIRQHFKRINLHEKGYKKRDIWLLQYHDFYMEHFGAFFGFISFCFVPYLLLHCCFFVQHKNQINSMFFGRFSIKTK
jgi:hypothetical protein